MKEYVVKVNDEIKEVFQDLKTANSYVRSLINVYEVSKKSRKIRVEKRTSIVLKEVTTQENNVISGTQWE